MDTEKWTGAEIRTCFRGRAGNKIPDACRSRMGTHWRWENRISVFTSHTEENRSGNPAEDNLKATDGEQPTNPTTKNPIHKIISSPRIRPEDNIILASREEAVGKARTGPDALSWKKPLVAGDRKLRKGKEGEDEPGTTDS